MYKKVAVKTKKPNGGALEAYEVKDNGTPIETLDNNLIIGIEIESGQSATSIQDFIDSGATEFEDAFCFMVKVSLLVEGPVTDPVVKKKLTITSCKCD